MKNFILVFALLICVYALHSCKSETIEDAKKLSLEKDFDLIKVNSNYEIKVLDYMISTDLLNEEASLQYMYAFKEEYIVIIDEPKQEFIDAYTDLNSFDNNQSTLDNYSYVQIEFLDQMMEPKHRTKSKSITVNNLDAHYIEMDAKLEGIKEVASYFIYYIESKGNLYTIMAWTLEKNKDIYREKVKKMIRTFNVKHYN